jgi:hypothetical protein
MPPYLSLGDRPGPYVAVMLVLFALFVARVVGQILAATVGPPWLPSMSRWYSGVMPYRYLLPSQLIIIALMVGLVVGVSTESGPVGAPQARIGIVVLWASYIYAAGMVWRAVRRAMQPAARRGVLIPIIFHFVLAAFLFVYAGWHLKAT